MKLTRIGTALAAGLLLALSASPHAEVAGGGCSGSTVLIVSGIIEGPDPIPPMWVPVGGGVCVLNPEGSERGDGRPDYDLSPSTGFPLIVWAYQTGTDRDIVFNEWIGEGWAGNEFLTSSVVEELDPRIDVAADDTVHVAWWEEAVPPRIIATKRSAEDSTWLAMPLVVSSNGRRPSITELDGLTLVAFERDGGAGQEVVIATSLVEGGYVEEVIAGTPRTKRLDVVVHMDQDRVWIDWKHSDTQFAYSERIHGEWTEATLVDWEDMSWVGEEETRRLIRRQLLD